MTKRVEEGGMDVTVATDKARIGIFKVFRESVTTEWKFGVAAPPNRPLETSRVKKLSNQFISKKEVLDRTHPAHRMECLVSKADWDRVRAQKGWAEKLVGEDVPEWPVEIDCVLELAAGQHRFEMLKDIHPRAPEQHWWWANLYLADGMCTYSSITNRKIFQNQPCNVSGKINRWSRTKTARRISW